MSPLRSRLAEWSRHRVEKRRQLKKFGATLKRGVHGRIVAVVHLSDQLDIERDYDTQF